jgi:hypothetical protein
MHNDFYAAGLYADHVDLYAIDNYSVTAFDLDWRTFPEVFSVIDHLESQVRPEFCPNRPLMVAELQAGWFAGWKGVPYEQIHHRLGRAHIGLITRSFLGQGGTIFNHYKAVGGTNWDHIGATDAYTSYDFSAPISESGIPTERLYEAKRINLLLSHFNLSRTDPAEPSEVGLSPDPALYKVRRDLTHEGAFWVFARNLTANPMLLSLLEDRVAEIPPYQAVILPLNYPIAYGWRIHCLTVEPLAHTTTGILIIPADRPVTLVLEAPDTLPLCRPPDGIRWEPIDSHRVQIQLDAPLAPDAMQWLRLGEYADQNTKIASGEANMPSCLFLGRDLADRLWHMDHENTYWIGPDRISNSEEVWVTGERPCWHLDATGQLHPVLPRVL